MTTKILLCAGFLFFALCSVTSIAEAHTITGGDCKKRAVKSNPRTLSQFRHRYRVCRKVAKKHRARHCDRSAQCVIRKVFGEWGEEAVRVARCESGFSPRATNGQYVGAFQMGAGERARWGHGRTVLAQARAAYRYFRYAMKTYGYHNRWQPWACKP